MRRSSEALRLMLTLFVLASTALAASGCGSGYNVLRGNEIQKRATTTSISCPAEGGEVSVNTADPLVVRAYFDRGGDLYPGLTVQARTPNAIFGSDSTQFLRETYAAPLAGHEAVWPAVMAELGVAGPNPATATDGARAWTEMQIAIRSRIAASVDTATRRPDGTRRPLVVLIHGFNTAEAECTYALVRDKVEPYAPDAAYLYVSWDGLVNNGITVWENAQYNFPLVGQGVRRLLGALPADLVVRSITHSSGGPVLAHALWNASAAESLDADECAGGSSGIQPYQDYLVLRDADRLPRPPQFADLRVGLIVPAGPAALFHNYSRNVRRPNRVVIGFNDRDFVVGRGPLWCSLKGDTCLPVRPSHACSVAEWVAPNPSAPHSEVALFDFSHSTTARGRKGLWEDHAFTTYLERDDMDDLLVALFRDGTVEDEADELCAGVRTFDLVDPTSIRTSCPALPQLGGGTPLDTALRLEDASVRSGTAAYALPTD